MLYLKILCRLMGCKGTRFSESHFVRTNDCFDRHFLLIPTNATEIYKYLAPIVLTEMSRYVLLVIQFDTFLKVFGKVGP